MRLHREAGGPAAAPGAGGPADAARALRRAARRISGTLHTFQAHLDADWAASLRPELAWVSGTLALEYTYAARLERLLGALHRLSGAAAPARTDGAAPARTTGRGAGEDPTGPRPAASPVLTAERGTLAVGAAKAGALLERRLTLARARAHSTALQALGSGRFHAVADQVALLAGEVPLARPGAGAELHPSAAAAEERLAAAVAALPLVTAGSPYNSQALMHGLSPDPAPHPQDAPWHQVRALLRLHRYARELLHGTDHAPATSRGPAPGVHPPTTGRALDVHPPTTAQALDPHPLTTDRALHVQPLTTDQTPDVHPTTGQALGLHLLTAGQALELHRDASEAAAAVAHAARTPRIAPVTAYALGVLHADQRHEVEAARYAFQRCWSGERSVPAP
ncbi:MAG TPA: CHAD domain-containing protein [Streptomyces sp.]|nr:CHAD domain-containing protein [Streptomyces sp.]